MRGMIEQNAAERFQCFDAKDTCRTKTRSALCQAQLEICRDFGPAIRKHLTCRKWPNTIVLSIHRKTPTKLVTLRGFVTRRDRRLRQLCAVHKVVFFFLKLYRHAPSRIHGICQPQYTMLPRIDWPNGSTTPAPDFAPLHPACSCLRSLLWPTNSVHDLSLVEQSGLGYFKILNFAGTYPKRNKTVRPIIWHLFLIWLTPDLMVRFMGKP